MQCKHTTCHRMELVSSPGSTPCDAKHEPAREAESNFSRGGCRRRPQNQAAPIAGQGLGVRVRSLHEGVLLMRSCGVRHPPHAAIVKARRLVCPALIKPLHHKTVTHHNSCTNHDGGAHITHARTHNVTHALDARRKEGLHLGELQRPLRI